MTHKNDTSATGAPRLRLGLSRFHPESCVLALSEGARPGYGRDLAILFSSAEVFAGGAPRPLPGARQGLCQGGTEALARARLRADRRAR